MFHALGAGGLDPTIATGWGDFAAAGFNPSVLFRCGSSISGIGTSKPEIIYAVQDLSKPICDEINKTLGIASTPTTTSLVYYCNGTFQDSKPDLSSALQKNGLSSDKAQQVSSEINDVISKKIASSSGSVDQKSVRSAIDAQIKSDVDSGTLTQDQANAVTKTLDSIEKQAAGHTPPAGGPPGGAPSSSGSSSDSNPSSQGQSSGGSGSKSSSSSKTETDRTTTIKGNIKTIVITYSDNSKETKTSYVANGDNTSTTIKDLVAAANKDASAKDQSAAADYLANTLQNGFVTDRKA